MVGEEAQIISGTDKTVGTLEEVKTYLEKATTFGFEAFKDINKEFEIVWEWAFEGGNVAASEGTGDPLDADLLDTWFGQYKADSRTTAFEYGGETYNVVTADTKTELTFDISVSLKQVQELA